MSHDHFESRLRVTLRDEAYSAPLRLDPASLRQRLAAAEPRRHWVHLALPAAAALAALAIIGVAVSPWAESVLAPPTPSTHPQPSLPSSPVDLHARFEGEGFSFDYPDTWRVISRYQHAGLHGPTVLAAVGIGDFDLGCTTTANSVSCGPSPRWEVPRDGVVLAYHIGAFLPLAIGPHPSPSLFPGAEWVDVGGRAAIFSRTALSMRWHFPGTPEFIEAHWGSQVSAEAAARVEMVVATWQWETPPPIAPRERPVCLVRPGALADGEPSPSTTGSEGDEIPAILPEHFEMLSPTCEEAPVPGEALSTLRFVTFDDRPAVSVVLYSGAGRPEPMDLWPTARPQELIESGGRLIRIWPEFLNDLRPVLLDETAPRVSAWDVLHAQNRVAEEVDRLFRDTSTCTTELGGRMITITFPASWQTNPAKPEQDGPGCNLFAPRLMDPGADTVREAGAVISFGAAGGALEGAVTGVDAIVSRLTLDGRTAIRFTRIGGFDTEGLTLVYYVALGETRSDPPTLSAAALSHAVAERALHRAVLDRMMQQIVIAD